MGNGRDFYTTKSYLDYIPSYKDIYTNLSLYIDYHPETVYHFSRGNVCFVIVKTSKGWSLKRRGLHNPRGVFETVCRSSDFGEILSKFYLFVYKYLESCISDNYNEEVPF